MVFGKILHGGRKAIYAEYNRCVDLVLEALDNRGFKAALFCLGGITTGCSRVVRKNS